MAIIKHIPVRNISYGEALDYLMFQHNEETQQLVLDAQGQKQLREKYYLDGILCDPMRFAQECEALNRQYHKNQSFEDVKAHHYIISFDPKDKLESGLTGEKAQALGLEFAKKYFPGHQAIVCTHMDGHNGSENIHVHIVFNSLRKMDVERQNFMERDYDNKAGYKHHETKAYMNILKQAVMDMCHREGLHQVDLLSPGADHISAEEYYAAKKGQKKLDELNQRITDSGLTPSQTKFQTQKQYLRDAITDISGQAKNFDEFAELLFEKYQIKTNLSRGRITYLHPERNKNIRGRALGAHYELEYLEEQFAKNREVEVSKNGFVDDIGTADKITSGQLVQRLKDTEHASKDRPNDYHLRKKHSFDPDYDYLENPISVLYIKSELRLVVRLQDCIKAQQSQAYAQKVKISNLQMMAETLVYIERNGYDSEAEISEKKEDISAKAKAAKASLDQASAEFKNISNQTLMMCQYNGSRDVYKQMLQAPNKKIFRQEHAKDIERYETARSYFRGIYGKERFPSMKELSDQRKMLRRKCAALKKESRYYQQYDKELATICSNLKYIFEEEQMPQHQESHEQSHEDKRHSSLSID